MRSLTSLISCTAADLLCHTNHFYYLYVATVSTFLCFFYANYVSTPPFPPICDSDYHSKHI